MEIERQFLIDTLPSLPNDYDNICQGYLVFLLARIFTDKIPRHFILETVNIYQAKHR